MTTIDRAIMVVWLIDAVLLTTPVKGVITSTPNCSSAVLKWFA